MTMRLLEISANQMHVMFSGKKKEQKISALHKVGNQNMHILTVSNEYIFG